MANIKITDLPSGTSLVGTELFESVQSATSVKLTSDLIKTFANKDPVLATITTNSNTPATAATLSHQSTSGSITAGIGVRLDFLCQTATSNTKIGTRLSSVSTNIGSGTEAFDLQVLLMTGGAAPTLAATFKSTGNFSITGNTVTVPNTRTPASAGAPGTKGDICWDTSYIYVCVATDTWKRTAISTW
jgi:hypothetical protein